VADIETKPESLDLAKTATTLDEVEEVLERLETGDYGRCGACGTSIDDEDLSVDPLRRFCRACSSRSAGASEEAS
jgi:DnaK suppressor protein